jgi:ribosomal protein S18 acetylase RimI-like enzyme
MSDITLRKATADDVEFAFQIKKAAFQIYIEKVWGWDEKEQRKIHKRRFDEQEFKIIQVSGADVGLLSLIRDDNFLKLNQIFILPKFQGKGIGKKCMEKIITVADNKNRPIQLRVLKVNKRVIDFYYRLGFYKISESNTHIRFEKKP